MRNGVRSLEDFCLFLMNTKKSNPKECLSITLDDNPEICKKYSIRYYPTVILFEKGKVKNRLDSEPGIGLKEQQLKEFTKNQ